LVLETENLWRIALGESPSSRGVVAQ